MYTTNTTRAHGALGAIATLVVISLVLMTVGFNAFNSKAEAANLTNFSDTLSDSDTGGTPSNHRFQFVTPNGVLAGQTIVINFPAGFNLNGGAAAGADGLDYLDIDLLDDASEITLGPSAAGPTWGVATTSNSITFTSASGVIGSSSVILIEIGTNATTAATGNTRILNPAAAGSYELTINGSMADSGQTRVAIVDDVVVTANVDTTFTFTVSGLPNGTSVNGSPTTTSTTTTATTLPFETLTANTSKVLAQQLNVTSNAINGFVVTVEQSQNLLSSTGADIDGFRNGAYNNTPVAWSSPTNVIGSENTWGHWGLTSEDINLNGDEFGSDLWVSASTTPRQIFSSTSTADGVTDHIGKTVVGYQAQISALQEAGDDYTTTLTYIATPTF